MRILGIDPGSVLCGYGVIDAEGKKLSIVEYGTIEVKKKSEDFPNRMKEIYDRINSLIQRTNPESSSIESTFYSKNVQSLIKLTMARSAAMMAIINNGIDINEYSAKEIKRAVTGRGGSSKEQVSFMMKAILDIKENPEYYDSTDALAIAVCHYNNASTVIGKNTNWKTFIKNNPHLIIDLNKNKKIK